MNLKEFFQGKRNSPDVREPQLTFLQANILATGLDVQANGVPWWYPTRVVDELRSQGVINVFQASGAHLEIVRLSNKRLLDARILQEMIDREIKDRGIQYRVNEDGTKARSKVDIRKESSLGTLSHAPIPERT